MSPFVKHLPGLLDDPQCQITDLPTRLDLRIAPLRDPVPSRAFSIPSPLEPNAPQDAEARASKAKLAGRKTTAAPPKSLIVTPKITPADVILARDGDGAKKPGIAIAISELLESTTRPPADYLFVSMSAVEKSFLPDPAFNSDDSRKRLRLDLDDAIVEDYIHLPRPHKQEHGKRTAPLLPAIVNGLHEPPPNAALLPPMAMEKDMKGRSVDDTSSRVLKTTGEAARRPPEKMLNSPEMEKEAAFSDVEPLQGLGVAARSPPSEKIAPKQTKLSKPRKSPRKWTSEETEDLLQGVAKHGIGQWKRILTDATFSFEGRRAMDLKDRFRVCAPDVYNVQKPPGSAQGDIPLRPSSPSRTNRALTRTPTIVAKPTGLLSENIIETTQPSPTRSTTPEPPPPRRKPAYPGKERVSSSRLAELGITTSGKLHSGRRTRRAWTAEEDENLLRGVAKHGFQWTAIHDDQEFDFSHHRKARDLRDRIRTRFPEGYKNADSAPLRSEKPTLARAVAGRAVRHPASAAATAAGPAAPKTKNSPSSATVKIKFGKSKPGTGGEKLKQQRQPRSVPLIDELKGSSDDAPATAAPEPSTTSTEITQEHLQAGTTLPSLALGDDGWDWGDNTLPPLLDWEDMGL